MGHSQELPHYRTTKVVYELNSTARTTKVVISPLNPQKLFWPGSLLVYGTNSTKFFTMSKRVPGHSFSISPYFFYYFFYSEKFSTIYSIYHKPVQPKFLHMLEKGRNYYLVLFFPYTTDCCTIWCYSSFGIWYNQYKTLWYMPQIVQKNNFYCFLRIPLIEYRICV